MTAFDIRGAMCASALSLFLLAGCGGDKIVREPVKPDRLQDVGDRISDEAIRSDHEVIEALRKRLRKLNETARWPFDNYHICKAQAWIDFAETEYTNNDRGSVTESALAQARNLIEGMEANDENIPTETTLIPESMVVRQDLWDFAAAIKKRRPPQASPCIDCDLARLEVRLVAAGHDHKELGWRHAASNVLACERLARAVRASGASCAAVIREATPAEVAKAVNQMRVPMVVHFAYNKSTLGNETAAVLARIAQVMRTYPQITATLYGHTDARGSEGYNQELGYARAVSVRTYLLISGVAPERIQQIVSRGKSEPLQSKDTPIRANAMDRRVELVFDHLPAAGDVGTERQQLDLQPDR